LGKRLVGKTFGWEHFGWKNFWLGKLPRGIQFVHGMQYTGLGRFGWKNIWLGKLLVLQTFGYI